MHRQPAQLTNGLHLGVPKRPSVRCQQVMEPHVRHRGVRVLPRVPREVVCVFPATKPQLNAPTLWRFATGRMPATVLPGGRARYSVHRIGRPCGTSSATRLSKSAGRSRTPTNTGLMPWRAAISTNCARRTWKPRWSCAQSRSCRKTRVEPVGAGPAQLRVDAPGVVGVGLEHLQLVDCARRDVVRADRPTLRLIPRVRAVGRPPACFRRRAWWLRGGAKWVGQCGASYQ